MRRLTLVLFVVYVAWSIIAVVEIVLRRHYGDSPLPGVLANHNGNIAVTGFIMAAAYPGAGIARLARRLQSRTLAWVAMACVPVAAVCFGTFFILMEVMRVYTPNVVDFRDLPGSVFGLACGTHFGLGFQRHMEQPAQRGRSEARAGSRHR